jgi:hypothetical protein
VDGLLRRRSGVVRGCVLPAGRLITARDITRARPGCNSTPSSCATPPRTRFERDQPAPEAIEAAAQAVEADLVVIGSHGRSGPARVLLGNDADMVLALVQEPVLVVKWTRVRQGPRALPVSAGVPAGTPARCQPA